MDDLARAREFFASRDWPKAYHAFKGAREHVSLTAEDLASLSEAAWWLGLVDECVMAG